MKKENKNRKSIRLKDYDYSSAGDYFITICTQDRECLFGEIIDEEMKLNEAGKIVEKCWFEIPKHFPDTELDIFQIMPNHIHFILRILEKDICIIVGNADLRSLQDRTKMLVPKIIHGFKSSVTRICNKKDLSIEWQKSYYDEIIVNSKHYDQVYNYIESNPQTWDRDKNNPKNI